jgi:cob(I)alamin adenosyltransferase
MVTRVCTVVHLTRIYTRTGDGGQTRLVDMSLTDKTDPRVAAYGDVDEANSQLGVALAAGRLSEPMVMLLTRVQNELFDLGADLGNPLQAEYAHEPLRITQPYVDRLEEACDAFGDPLPALRSFVLPGGSVAAAHLHVARTIVRRAERTAWTAAERYGTDSPGGLNPLAVTYLNRLSDLLFILARAANATDASGPGDVLWVPGGDRAHSQKSTIEGDPA